MQSQKSSLSLRAFLFGCFLIFGSSHAAAQTNNIPAPVTQALDETTRARKTGAFDSSPIFSF
jgi:hypothetical protein